MVALPKKVMPCFPDYKKLMLLRAQAMSAAAPDAVRNGRKPQGPTDKMCLPARAPFFRAPRMLPRWFAIAG